MLWKHIGRDAEIIIPARAPERKNLKCAGLHKSLFRIRGGEIFQREWNRVN
jgi:hypothetical protein